MPFGRLAVDAHERALDPGGAQGSSATKSNCANSEQSRASGVPTMVPGSMQCAHTFLSPFTKESCAWTRGRILDSLFVSCQPTNQPTKPHDPPPARNPCFRWQVTMSGARASDSSDDGDEKEELAREFQELRRRDRRAAVATGRAKLREFFRTVFKKTCPMLTRGVFFSDGNCGTTGHFRKSKSRDPTNVRRVPTLSSGCVNSSCARFFVRVETLATCAGSPLFGRIVKHARANLGPN